MSIFFSSYYLHSIISKFYSLKLSNFFIFSKISFIFRIADFFLFSLFNIFFGVFFSIFLSSILILFLKLLAFLTYFDEKKIR